MAFYIYDEEKQLPEVILPDDGKAEGVEEESEETVIEIEADAVSKKPFPSSVFAVQCFFSALLILVAVIIKATDTLPNYTRQAVAETLSYSASLEQLNAQLWDIIEESDILSAAFNMPTDVAPVYENIFPSDMQDAVFAVSYGMDGWESTDKYAIAPYIPARRISALGTVKRLSQNYSFIYPLSGRISSPYGNRIDPIDGKYDFHSGIDIAAPSGTPIKCAASGIVSAVGYTEAYGNCVTVAHSGGYYSFYAHCKKTLVEEGESVSQGDIIALVGSTGKSTGNHLHFELRRDGVYVDPLEHLGAS